MQTRVDGALGWSFSTNVSFGENFKLMLVEISLGRLRCDLRNRKNEGGMNLLEIVSKHYLRVRRYIYIYIVTFSLASAELSNNKEHLPCVRPEDAKKGLKTLSFIGGAESID